MSSLALNERHNRREFVSSTVDFELAIREALSSCALTRLFQDDILEEVAINELSSSPTILIRNQPVDVVNLVVAQPVLKDEVSTQLTGTECDGRTPVLEHLDDSP